MIEMFRIVHKSPLLLVALAVVPQSLSGIVFADVREVVHDPAHRPVEKANITLRVFSSEYQQNSSSNADGEFEFTAVPVGEYRVKVTHKGFAPVVTTFGNSSQTNDQLSFGSHTEKFAYYVGLNGNRSDYGLQTPGPAVKRDRGDGFGGFRSLIKLVDSGRTERQVIDL